MAVLVAALAAVGLEQHFGPFKTIGDGYGYGCYGGCPEPTTTVLSGPIGGGGSGPGAVTVAAGADRDHTAIAESMLAFPNPGSAKAVVLARDDLFPDALGGSRLATAKGGPLLLTPTATLNPDVETEIKRVLSAGGTVYVLGGKLAIDPSVDDKLKADGFVVVRESGDTRFETAVDIAQSDQQGVVADVSGANPPILIATGFNFPDGLTAGAAAGAVNGVVLLSRDTSPDPAADAFIASHPTSPLYAVGGQAATAYPKATPLVGATRFETAVAVANQFFANPANVGIATGFLFPDALSGGATIGHFGGPLLLTDPAFLSVATAGYLTANKSSIKQNYVFGGDAAVSPAVRTAITQAET